MKTKFMLLLSILPFFSLSAQTNSNWQTKNLDSIDFYFMPSDAEQMDDYQKAIEVGAEVVQYFFQEEYTAPFDVYMHPNRSSLDSTWQKDWQMPTFKSECWMVASGVASKLDLLSPRVWSEQACEHDQSDQLKTLQLIAHELVHVFHGQLNPSPDFSDVTGLDWFVEGLATYASGQLDSTRIQEVQLAISQNQIPASLKDFWSGKLRYGLSGTVVMFIDQKYGREKLIDLLKFNRLEDLLQSLSTTEADLLDDWQAHLSLTEK